MCARRVVGSGSAVGVCTPARAAKFPSSSKCALHTPPAPAPPRYVKADPPFISIGLDISDSGREGCAVSTLTITCQPAHWKGTVQVGDERPVRGGRGVCGACVYVNMLGVVAGPLVFLCGTGGCCVCKCVCSVKVVLSVLGQGCFECVVPISCWLLAMCGLFPRLLLLLLLLSLLPRLLSCPPLLPPPGCC